MIITRNFTRGREMMGRALIIPTSILYYNTKMTKIQWGGGKSGEYLGIPPLCIKLSGMSHVATREIPCCENIGHICGKV